MTDNSGSKSFFSPREPDKGPTEQVRELGDLVVSYTKQETIDPLKTVGANLGYGIAGAILIGVGWIFALLALLRGLQTIDTFNDPLIPEGGRWTWVPYVIVTLTGLVIVGVYGWMVQKRLNEGTDK